MDIRNDAVRVFGCCLGLAGCVFLGSVVLARYQSYTLVQQGAGEMEKARQVSRELLVKRVVAYQAATKKFASAAERNPLDSRPWFELAEALLEIGQAPDIVPVFDPSAAGFTRAEGEAGMLRMAYAAYARAIAKDPANAIYRQRLGDVLDRMGEYAAAQEQLSMALKLDPNNLTLYVYLCEYYRAKGDEGKFSSYLEKLKELHGRANLRGGDVDARVRGFLDTLKEGKGT